MKNIKLILVTGITIVNYTTICSASINSIDENHYKKSDQNKTFPKHVYWADQDVKMNAACPPFILRNEKNKKIETLTFSLDDLRISTPYFNNLEKSISSPVPDTYTTDENKAQVLRSWGDAEAKLGHYPKAIQYYDSALKILEITDYTKAHLLNSRAFAKAYFGMHQQAILDLEESLKFKSVFSQEELSLSHEKLARLYQIHSRNNIKDDIERRIKMRFNDIFFYY